MPLKQIKSKPEKKKGIHIHFLIFKEKINLILNYHFEINHCPI